ncbi:MAG: ATP-binding protein [Coriobacteriia bacterium]|nr:ATP-binding protein [Coriobacteriia bacterium]
MEKMRTKPRALGIFGKVFLYTTLIVVLVVGVTALFFTKQISDALAISQQEQLSSVFKTLQQELESKTGEDAIEVAKAFHRDNQFFEFCVLSPHGQILYATPNYLPIEMGFGGPVTSIAPGVTIGPYTTFGPGPTVVNPGPNTTMGPNIQGGALLGESPQAGTNFHTMLTTADGLIILISAPPSTYAAYSAVIQKTIIAVLLLLLVGIFCSFLFARSIAKPVKALAGDTAKMASLELVPAPVARADEIGSMANDVYSMYERLKLTIRRLEDELRKQKEMEENQRYFFAAASHELKTPVAATSALLEGMVEGVIPQPEQMESLRTCLRLANEQAELISEILELVRLDDRKLRLSNEKINLKKLVDSALPAHLALAQTQSLGIDIAVPSELEVTLDQALFKRAFSNVVANALQNTSKDGNVRIYCERRKKKAIRLFVLNEGPAIPEEALEKLFEPFYRPDQARSSSAGRSGLGLALVAKALSQMGIVFALENTPEGPTFWMDLPL